MRLAPRRLDRRGWSVRHVGQLRARPGIAALLSYPCAPEPRPSPTPIPIPIPNKPSACATSHATRELVCSKPIAPPTVALS